LIFDIRFVSGASGGMVGAAYFVASLQRNPSSKRPEHPDACDRGSGGGNWWESWTRPTDSPTNDELLNRLSDDMLSSVFKGLLFRDLPSLALPLPVCGDRGQLLEDVWRLNMGKTWEASFSALAAGERAGWRPSLVFSPMLVEDGRQLLISNLDLAPLVKSEGNYVDAAKPDFYSQSAFEFFRLFPNARDEFPISTAARMSASFPYFSPAAVLPTTPRRRVVDAGYYDNYGVSLAANWLHGLLNDPACLDILQREVSGVALIEIRDGLGERSQPPDGIGESGQSTTLSRGFEELSSPGSGLFSSRDSVSIYRNDEKLAALSLEFNRLFPACQTVRQFFTDVQFQYGGDVPLSWYLTRWEIRDLVNTANAQMTGSGPTAFLKWWEAACKTQPARVI
jgi:hypothetical protein